MMRCRGGRAADRTAGGREGRRKAPPSRPSKPHTFGKRNSIAEQSGLSVAMIKAPMSLIGLYQQTSSEQQYEKYGAIVGSKRDQTKVGGGIRRKVLQVLFGRKRDRDVGLPEDSA